MKVEKNTIIAEMQDAINHDRSADLDFTGDGLKIHDITAEMFSAGYDCDDYVEIEPGVYDAWGTTDHGEDWRATITI